jgi:hypothetical protein
VSKAYQAVDCRANIPAGNLSGSSRPMQPTCHPPKYINLISPSELPRAGGIPFERSQALVTGILAVEQATPPQYPPPSPTAFQSSITRFTGRSSAFLLAAKANSRTSPRNVEVQSPVGQSENRQPQNRMRGNLYAKGLLVSGVIRLTGSALTTRGVNGGWGCDMRAPAGGGYPLRAGGLSLNAN